jgi:predicted Holliday junction resolvase-like endonuclease|tara:strand:+ start:450 stop:680 length:231 start_codon:yes stop_codon:yes gene_type:complete
MEVFTLIIFIVIIYLLYILINTISSLRSEVYEMKNKCIKTVYNNDKDKLQNTEALDIKKDIADKYNFFTNMFKKMI